VLAKAIGSHHALDREGGPAAGIAVELGEDHRIEGQRLVEGAGRGHGVLADHGVDDQERVVRIGGVGDPPDLLHEGGVDGQAPGGVDDGDVLAQAARLFHPGPGDRHGVGGLAEHGDPGLRPQNPQLLHGGRALEVGPDEDRVAPLLLPPLGQLGRGGRLPGSLQTGHQHDGRGPRGVGDLEALPAEDAHQLLVHRLDDLLARREAGRQGLGADPEADAVAEAAGHRQLDVGLEECRPDFPQGLVEVGFADASLAPQAGRDPLEAVGEGVEHGPSG